MRIDTLLIDYLGVKDIDYVRAVKGDIYEIRRVTEGFGQ